jgi:hypothetical protein
LEYVSIGKEIYNLRIIIEYSPVCDIVWYGRPEKDFNSKTIIQGMNLDVALAKVSTTTFWE